LSVSQMSKEGNDIFIGSVVVVASSPWKCIDINQEHKLVFILILGVPSSCLPSFTDSLVVSPVIAGRFLVWVGSDTTFNNRSISLRCSHWIVFSLYIETTSYYELPVHSSNITQRVHQIKEHEIWRSKECHSFCNWSWLRVWFVGHVCWRFVVCRRESMDNQTGTCSEWNFFQFSSSLTPRGVFDNNFASAILTSTSKNFFMFAINYLQQPPKKT
jgi:hypothetical protein